MPRKRGHLAHEANLTNVYRNHHELAGKAQQHGAVLCGPKAAENHCMCCGHEPGDRKQLHEIEIQTKPDQEYYQIGIVRCEQILTAAFHVRRLASADAAVQAQMQQYEDQLNQPPLVDEIRRMAGLLLPDLSPADQAILRANLHHHYGFSV